LFSRFEIYFGNVLQVNILIAASGAACLADFGLSAVRDSQLFSSFSSSSPRGGTLRWQAPELLNIGAGGSAVESAENSCNSSRASDMYAFACVVYEVHSSRFTS
jgi:serine/threonine protein kinase